MIILLCNSWNGVELYFVRAISLRAAIALMSPFILILRFITSLSLLGQYIDVLGMLDQCPMLVFDQLWESLGAVAAANGFYFGARNMSSESSKESKMGKIILKSL